MRPNILVVDDSKRMRNIVRETLGAYDCDVAEAANGFNAFFVIERARTDLILLDVSMPLMGGLETLARLKAAPELAAIPVIMLTSPADHALMGEWAALGAVGALVKPFSGEQLAGKVREILILRPLPQTPPSCGG